MNTEDVRHLRGLGGGARRPRGGSLRLPPAAIFSSATSGRSSRGARRDGVRTRVRHREDLHGFPDVQPNQGHPGADGGGRGPQHPHGGPSRHQHRRQRLRRRRRADARRRPGKHQGGGRRRRQAAAVLRPGAHRAVLAAQARRRGAAHRPALHHRRVVHHRHRDGPRDEKDERELGEARDSAQGDRHLPRPGVHQARPGAQHPPRHPLPRGDDGAAEAVRQGSVVR